jgi:hypothetical protein
MKMEIKTQLLTITEIPNAAIQGPKIMVICVGIGTFTGAIFLIVLLFVAGNIDDVISSAAGPLLQILIHATSNTAGAICLLMFVLVHFVVLGMILTVICKGSRLCVSSLPRLAS